MRRTLFLLLVLMVLTACGTPARQEPETLPEEPPAAAETFPLPETGPAGSLSAPAIVTEGRKPEQTYDLPRRLCGNIANEDFPLLAAELPEEDAAFYGIQWETALIRWGASEAEFDWVYLTPRQILPRLFCLDVDGDWEDELILICYVGSGTGVSVDELHIIEKGPDGTLTDYALPESLWQEQVPTLFNTAVIDGRTFAMLGHELAEFDGNNLDLETASAGLIARFDSDGTTLSFGGAFCLCHEGSAAPCYVAETSAEVRFQNGVFTMQDFHLYSFDQ